MIHKIDYKKNLFVFLVWIWKTYNNVFIGLFFLLIFLLSRVNPRTPDTFYHVKTGEIFFHYGILYKDIYSFTAYGRAWFPYEWLFEIIVYMFQAVFGYASLSYLAAGIITIQVSILFFFLKKYFKMSALLSFLLCALYFLWSYYPFFDIRPQIFALLFFTVTAISILWYIKTNRNFLWVPLINILLWTNLHSSVIFGLYMFFSYAIVCFVFFMRTNQTIWMKKTKILILYGIAATIFTILPPLGTLQYKLLFFVSQHLFVISKFINEWAPLSAYTSATQYAYSFPLLTGIILFSYFSLKEKKYTSLLLLVPLFIFLILPYFSYRNLIFAYVILLFIWAQNISMFIQFVQTRKLWSKIALIICLFILMILHGINLYNVYLQESAPETYPIHATDFLLKNHIQGNMFNTFNSGSYLIYRLYPQYKVFIDLRADVYLCCEIPKYQDIINSVSTDTFSSTLSQKILDPYNISFVVLSIKNDLVSQKIAQTLNSNPHWELVFWDDYGAIFVKKDGKNVSVLNEFGTSAVTPFENTLYASSSAKQAFFEYNRMTNISDSAKSRNALGFFYFQQKQYKKAQEEFQKAINLDPTFDSPYMNLGEVILLENNNYSEAITLYKKALAINPRRAYTYIRLGQLYLQGENDTTAAITTWEAGKKAFSKSTIQDTFKQLIQRVLKSSQ